MATSTGAEVNRYKYGGKELETRKGLNFHDFEARMLFNDRTIFNRPDPQSAQTPWVSSYTYCLGNPIKYNDPSGEIPLETIWDIGNVIYDIGAAVYHHAIGDHEAAKDNWVDLGLDAAAVVIPYVPAGTFKAVKNGANAAKAVDKASDAARVVDKAEIIESTIKKADSNQLRKALGLKTGDGLSAHHVIPKNY